MHLNVLQSELEKLCNKLENFKQCACHIPSVIQNTKTLMESLIGGFKAEMLISYE